MIRKTICLKKDYIIKNINDISHSKTFFDHIRNNIALGLQFGTEYPQMYAFSEMFMKERGSEIYQKVFDYYQNKEDVYMNMLIRNGIAAGDLRDDISSEIITSIIQHILTNINNILNIDNIEDYKSKIEFLFTFLEKGLQSPN